MATIQNFSARVIDYAERLSGIADAAEGKHRPKPSRTTRWLLLPASGAAMYALLRSDTFSRQAKEVMDEAKTRASELPDDLMARVRQSSGQASSQNGSRTGASSTTRRKRTTPRRTSSRKKTTASSRA